MDRKKWVKQYKDIRERRELAKHYPLAWILEYQPEILLPKVGLVPFEPYPYQQEVLNCEDKLRLVNKSRQIGFSTSVACEVAWEATNVPGSVIVIVSKDKEAAKNFHEYVYRVLDSVKDRVPDFPRYGKKNTMETTFPDINSKIVSLTASSETGRSFSGTHLIFDECAFALYAREIYQAASPTISATNGRVTVISTPKGRENLFYDLHKNADDYGFTTFQFEWWYCPIYNRYVDKWLVDHDPKWIEKAKKDEWYIKTKKRFSELAFKQEYECNFDAGMDMVFTKSQLKESFRKNWLDLDDSDYISTVALTSEPIKGHYYATGVDLGRKRDATVALTYDITEIPAKVVDFRYIEGGSSDWEGILLTVRAVYEKFEPEMKVDATGVGDAIYERLSDIAEPCLISDGTSSRVKYNLIENLRLSMDKRAIVIPRVPVIFKEHEQYTWQDKKIRQDCVIANAMAVSIFFDPEDEVAGIDKDFSYTDNE